MTLIGNSHKTFERKMAIMCGLQTKGEHMKYVAFIEAMMDAFKCTFKQLNVNTKRAGDKDLTLDEMAGPTLGGTPEKKRETTKR